MKSYRESLFYTTTDAIRKARPSVRNTRTLSELRGVPRAPEWSCGAVEKQPDIRLHTWSAIDAVNFGKSQHPSTRHLVGNAGKGSGFCLSSAIRTFDPKTQRALAENGTVYALVGDATPDDIITEKCHLWLDEQLLHTINTTRMFVHAVATAKPTVVYTIALAMARDTPPAEIGRLSVTRDGLSFDAVYQGTVWSTEVRTLRLSGSIHKDESILALVVRLLEQVDVSDRVCTTAHTDYFKLSVHIGPTALYALEVESLETVPSRWGKGHELKYSDRNGQELTEVFQGNAVSPLDVIVSTFPAMGERLLRTIAYEREELSRLTAPRSDVQSKPAAEQSSDIQNTPRDRFSFDDFSDDVPF